MSASKRDRAALFQEQDEFGEVVAKYKGLVFHVVRSMTTDISCHEDLAQDIFVKVFESLPRFQHRCSLATWISRIAYNMCINSLRRSRSRPQDNPEYRADADWMNGNEPSIDTNARALVPESPQDMVCRKEQEAALRQVVTGLPMHYRLVITLHYLEDFSIQELAHTLDMPQGTIKSYLFRARARLKSDLLKTFTAEDLLS